jgi:hypothetical protein
MQEFDDNDRNRVATMINGIEQYLAQVKGISAPYHLCVQDASQLMNLK